MKRIQKLLFSLLCVFMVAGCSRTAPINTVQSSIANNLTIEQVSNVILQSGTERKWQMKVVEPNLIEGVLSTAKYSVTINIRFTEKEYSIKHMKSINLRANKGKIHKSYNRWVNNLDHDIQKHLKMILS